MELDKELLDRVLGALGDVLKARGLRYELVAIGGTGLMGPDSKHIQDLELLEPSEHELLGAAPLGNHPRSINWFSNHASQGP